MRIIYCEWFSTYKISRNSTVSDGTLGKILGRRLRPLLKTGFPLVKNVFKSLAKSVLIPLGLTAVASATDATIQKKVSGSGMKTLIISN